MFIGSYIEIIKIGEIKSIIENKINATECFMSNYKEKWLKISSNLWRLKLEYNLFNMGWREYKFH